MFTITRHHVVNVQEICQEFHVKFQKQPTMELLGTGCFSDAWICRLTNKAIKITSENDWGYLAYLEEISQQPIQNPWVPAIDSVDVYRDNSKNIAIITKMELLTRRWDSWGKSDAGYESYRQMSQDIREHSDGNEKHEWITNNSDLVSALSLIDRAQKRSKTLKDLHAGNFMMRGPDQLVIIDPLSYRLA